MRKFQDVREDTRDSLARVMKTFDNLAIPGAAQDSTITPLGSKERN
jgi:hypothetical protein